MKIVFFGSDDFAAECFRQIDASSHNIVGCVTQPDRQKGRGMKLTASPIKELGEQRNLPVLQPVDLTDTDFLRSLRNFQADVFVVVAYGKILTKDILRLPKIFCVNVHASLLPRYRGAAPVNWAVINGDKTTGVTIMKMSPTLDSGEIISQVKVAIDAAETSADLRVKLAQKGAELLVETLSAIQAEAFTLTQQDAAAVSWAPKLTKEQGLIRWSDTAEHIHNLIRGLQPWPGVYTHLDGKMLKVLKADVAERSMDGRVPGEVVEVIKDGFYVATGHNCLLIRRVHLESGKPMSAGEFLQGCSLTAGRKLG